MILIFTLWLALSVPFGVLVGRVIKGGASK